MCSWKHQEPFQAALGTKRPLTKQAMTLLMALSPPPSEPQSSQFQIPAQTGLLPKVVPWVSPVPVPAVDPALPSLQEALSDALQPHQSWSSSSPSPTRLRLPLSSAPPGIFPEPHIYLMLMPRCLDIHHVLSWESN